LTSEIAVSGQGLLKSAESGQQLSFVVAEDLGVTGVVGGPESQGVLHIAQRWLKLAELEFAEAAEGGCGGGIRHETEVMVERVDGLHIVIDAVAELAEVPPAIRPGGVDKEGMGVQVGGASDFAGLAGGVGIGSELIEGRLLR
jgi:hypothetical protein